MKNETKTWLDYADENLESARILKDSDLFNSCLQNIQQCVEKLLKAVLIELSDRFIKTHSILRLKQEIENIDLLVNISEEECDLLDTIYLPSKYPVNSVLPDYEPDIDICNECLKIAFRVDESVKIILKINKSR